MCIPSVARILRHHNGIDDGEKKSHCITYATLRRPLQSVALHEWLQNSIYLLLLLFLVYFSVQLSMEQLLHTCPNSKNDSLSCLAGWARKMQSFMIAVRWWAFLSSFFSRKVFPSRDAIAPADNSIRPYLAWMRRCRLRAYSIHTKYSDNLYRLSVDLRTHVVLCIG